MLNNKSDESSIALGGHQEEKRRELIKGSREIDILKDEIRTMQGQLAASYIRIKELNEKLEAQRKQD